MGFLSAYKATTRVWLTPDYWVDMLEFLPKSDYDAAQRQLLRVALQTDAQGRTTGISNPDTVQYQEELVVRSIVDWNLTDEGDKPLPLQPLEARRQSVRKLPQSAFLVLYEEVKDRNNPPSKEERVQFHDGDSGVDSSGADDESDADRVLAS